MALTQNERFSLNVGRAFSFRVRSARVDAARPLGRAAPVVEPLAERVGGWGTEVGEKLGLRARPAERYEHRSACASGGAPEAVIGG